MIRLIESEEIKMMQAAYRKLYEIENMLRNFISRRMRERYGPLWFYKAPKLLQRNPPRASIEKLYLYELERSFLRIYQPFKDLPPNFYLHLHNVYPIRNQIAHTQRLTREQADTLSENHSFITKYIS